MASEMVDPIDWSHLPPYTGQYPLSSTYCTLQCGLQIARLAVLSQPRTCDFRMPDQRTAGAATQGKYFIKYFKYLIFYQILIANILSNTSSQLFKANSLSNTISQLFEANILSNTISQLFLPMLYEKLQPILWASTLSQRCFVAKLLGANHFPAVNESLETSSISTFSFITWIESEAFFLRRVAVPSNYFLFYIFVLFISFLSLAFWVFLIEYLIYFSQNIIYVYIYIYIYSLKLFPVSFCTVLFSGYYKFSCIFVL